MTRSGVLEYIETAVALTVEKEEGEGMILDQFVQVTHYDHKAGHPFTLPRWLKAAREAAGTPAALGRRGSKCVARRCG